MSKSQVMEIIKKRDLSHSINNDDWYKITIKPKEGDLDSELSKGSEFKVSEIRLAFLSNSVFEVNILSDKIKIHRKTEQGGIPKIDYTKTSFDDLANLVRWLKHADFKLSMRHGPRIMDNMITINEVTDMAANARVNFGFWNIEKHKIHISLSSVNVDENLHRCGSISVTEFSGLRLGESNL